MLEYLVFGSGFAFAAAVQPGPFQAFLLSSVARRGWKLTLPASLAPLISDVPIAILVLFVLNRIPQKLSGILRGAGALFLIYLAWGAYEQWRRQRTPNFESVGSEPHTIIQAVVVNVLNPNPYLGWSLVLGPAFIHAWSRGPAGAMALIVAFYFTIIIVTAGIVLLFGATRFLGSGGSHKLILVSAITLAILGAYQLAMCLRALLG